MNNCGCTPPYIGPSLATSCYGGTFVLFMSILDTFVRNTCEISEICQRITPTIEPDYEYDFIVIGSGSSGSVVASRLSEISEWRILLIEAGGDEPPGSQVPSMASRFVGNPITDWNYETEPEENACLASAGRRCKWPRGKVLGGCTVINGMNYMRGVPRDYDNWAEAGNNGWSYNEVLPYFKKSEGNEEIGTVADPRYHGVDGPMTTKRSSYQPDITGDLLEAAEEIGIPVVDDLEKDKWVGITVSQLNIRNGSRLSTARAFLRPARNRINLHIMLNSTATKILIETKGSVKLASGITLIYNDKTYNILAKKEVILSAGVINSPQLLLLSGVGPKEELDKVDIPQIHELPGVGKNLQNHVKFSMSYLLKKRKNYNDLNWAAVTEYLLFKKGPLTSTGLSQVTARINSKFADPSGLHPDLQIYFVGYSASCSKTAEVNAPQDPDYPDAPKKIGIAPAVLHTKSRGYVTLKSNNPLDPPLMYAKYFSAPEDIEVMLDGIRIIHKLANTSVLKENYGLEIEMNIYGTCGVEYEYDSDDFWKCAIQYFTRPENHQVGTCKMGPKTDPLAVVDPELNVHGIENLRVMDASIIPVIISGRSHSTCVMLAEKGVDHIKEKWLECNRNNSETDSPCRSLTERS